MNVLEKILEELENESQLAHEEMRRCARGNPLQFDEVKGYARAMEYVVDTIRSHMEKRKKVSRARIITRKIDEKSYYEIEYKETGKDEYDVGYGSYDLNNVISWFNEYFEFCGEAKVVSDNNGWIPVSERLPEEGKMVKVTVHSSGWIADYDSAWVPEEEKTYHSEEYGVYDGYLSRAGEWRFYDDQYSENTCVKEFGTNKEIVYDVVTAWMPKEQIEPYKEG